MGRSSNATLTKRLTLELTEGKRKQGALLELWDHLSWIRLAVEKSLENKPDRVRAAEDGPSKMVRQLPRAATSQSG